MTDKDKIYIAALLHDIGKFIERSKDKDWQDNTYKYVRNKEASNNYAHRRYSALFVETYLAGNEFFKEYSNSISELVLHHHNDKKFEVEVYRSIDDRGILEKIIRIADDLASSEREEDKSLDPGKYYLVNLESPFNDIKITTESGKTHLIPEDKKKYLYPAELKLDNSNQFPKNEKEVKGSENNKYPELVENFLSEIKNIESEKSLLSLMEKYLTQVPAQTPTEFNGKKHLYKPDLNLFDHSRTVAAIAVVLYEEFKKGAYKGLENKVETSVNKETKKKKYIEQLSNVSNPSILLYGNVNGIQDFIFDVKSKRAAKSLKGRSYFVQLLTEVVSKYIIDQWELKEANILYNGGGNFFILAPNYRKKDLQIIRNKIAEELLNTKLYLSIGATEITFDDFSKFGNAFKRAVNNSNEIKKQKFKGFEINKIFEPFPQLLKGEMKYDKLAEDLQLATNYYIGSDFPNKYSLGWEEIFRKLGYQVSPRPNVEIEKQGTVFNTIEFSKEYESFKLAVKDLPNWTFNKITEFENIVKEKGLTKEQYEIEDEEIPTGNRPLKIIPFSRFAQYAFFKTGTEKLGVLKMDIDNLGKIFKDGLTKPTIGRVASLSRTLKWFFEGYMNTLITSEIFKDRIYPIFSGGDDFFVVGSWNKIFEFAIKVREEFRKFVCEHKGITLSASLIVIDESYPIKQIARLAEERLEDAKDRRDIKTDAKLKDAVSVFDTVLSWDDFYIAKQLKEKIVEVIKLTNRNRAIINKIQKSSVGFAAIQKEALFNNVIRTYKVWRLNYYLRDLANVSKKNPNKEKIEKIIEDIVKQYEELFFEAFKGNKTSIQIFPIAARWAELETRNIKGDK